MADTIRFVARFLCIECGQRLSEDVRYYSNGVCPLCGSRGSGTICATKKIVVKQRLVKSETFLGKLFGVSWWEDA